jgi:predicted O-methyltransferase YrrM
VYGVRRGSEPTRFCLAKPPVIVDRYAAYLAELAPRTIVEVGILEGASTALFADLARPQKLVAIDHDDAPTAKLRDFIARRGLGDTVAVYGGVDQADVAALQAIVDAELGGAELDLVVDDASHRLELTRPTFNFFFPRLRPGGAYLLEDWATGLRAGGPVQLDAAETPLVQLVYEVLATKGRHPRVIGDVTVKAGWTIIERGPAPIDGPFDVRSWGSEGPTAE